MCEKVGARSDSSFFSNLRCVGAAVVLCSTQTKPSLFEKTADYILHVVYQANVCSVNIEVLNGSIQLSNTHTGKLDVRLFLTRLCFKSHSVLKSPNVYRS